MENAGTKRKADGDGRRAEGNKKAKGKKNWDMPRWKSAPQSIQPGDTGIWATCAMKKEAKSIGDLRDLFQEYAGKIYGTASGTAEDEASESEGGDIEAEINKELADIRKPATKPLFTSIKLDTQCRKFDTLLQSINADVSPVIFFRTRAPVEPVSFVHRICQDIADGAQPRNLRYVKRLTPITAYEKATNHGLEAVAKQVLAPHFHGEDKGSKKFAIRPSIRNNKDFTRDGVIKTVAAAVGPGHKVDLHGYDILILVEIYKNMVGMSVVGPDFEKLKRFNIDELRQSEPATTKDSAEVSKTETDNQDE